MKLERVLAIDYGTKRTGIAVTDSYRIIATPLQTVLSKDVFIFLEDYMKKEEVGIFVVGVPKNLNGTQCEFYPLVKNFIKVLHQRFPTKRIHEYDERYTSKMAIQSLLTGGFSKTDRKNKSNIDMISAAIILQSFLDYAKNVLKDKL
jgi:putative Holliday junction resolvase